MKPIKHINITKEMSTNDLVKAMEQANVMGAKRIAKATNIIERMIKDKDCKIFLGIAGAMVPGGMKNIIIDMLKHVDVFVTTGATLTHDLIEALGHKHYQGTQYADDAKLNKEGIDRIYDSFMKNNVYPDLEDFTKKVFDKIKGTINIKELLWKIGDEIEDENSILATCAKNKIPIFCPALSDSALGLQVMNYNQEKKLVVDGFDDLKEISELAWTAKKAGVIYIGGGVPKNYVQQAMQFSPNQAAYGVQIKVDHPEFGGSSGADLKEGISWGKMNENADFVDVICDATVALPLIYAAVKSRL